MPKKWQGENSKAAEARARKDAKKVEENEQKERQKEDEYWRDDDKNVQKKLQRKEDRERKKHEQQERKQATLALLEKETEGLAGKSGSSQKMTQAEIAAQQEQFRLERQKAEEKARLETSKIVVRDSDKKIEENVNRLVIEGEQARTVDEALLVLGGSSADADRHPEKRMKAAFATFEERRLSVLKAENPNLRLSQLKQMVKKEWQRSPENPMNQIRTDT